MTTLTRLQRLVYSVLRYNVNFIGMVEEEHLMIILGYFSYFSIKTYIVGPHWKRLDEALRMSTATYVFTENLRNLSQNYYQIFPFNKSVILRLVFQKCTNNCSF